MKILVINCGSSSIKYRLLDMPERKALSGATVERVRNHKQALRKILRDLPAAPDAVGHRVVHGGEEFRSSVLITPEVIKAIRRYSALAPLHNPPNLAGITATLHLLPGLPQVAAFDTAFFTTLPPRAYLYAIPYKYYKNARVRRYGFHGTSHRYCALRAAEILGKPFNSLNLITAHLGNGASIAAIEKGKAIDTSMGMTPLEGLVMGSRSGDIDPSIIFYLARREKTSPQKIYQVLNKKSGLLGISGISNDLREIRKAKEKGDERAALAMEIFAYRLRKYIGAYWATLGNLDALVFTGGIGENAPDIRKAAIEGLFLWGLVLDGERNRAALGKEMEITQSASRVRAFVIPTDEELMIAHETFLTVTSAKGGSASGGRNHIPHTSVCGM